MDPRFLERAVALAARSVARGGGPFGAVVVRGGTVIAQAANRVTASHDPTAHAEVRAIRAACRKLGTHQLDGCEIYSSCEPCPMCLGAIYWARLSAVYFAASREDAARAGFDDQFIYDEIARLRGRRIPFRHVREVDGRSPFTAWKKEQNKTKY
jgi:guanine deaminase